VQQRLNELRDQVSKQEVQARKVRERGGKGKRPYA
jgi:hypothetical protein